MAVTVVCEVCGKAFEASRRSAKYCSNACKMRKRNRAGYRKDWVKPPAPDPAAAAEVQRALMDAHRAANDIGRLAATAPLPLRAACARISQAIHDALKAEGL